MTPLQRRVVALEASQRHEVARPYCITPAEGETSQQAADRAGRNVVVAPAVMSLADWMASAARI